MQASENQKKVIDHIRSLFNKELKEMTNAKRIIGIDTKYVMQPRSVRPVADGNEPKALLFGGNAYAHIRMDNVQAVYLAEDGKSHVKENISSEVVEEAFNSVFNDYLANGSVDIEGHRFTVIDPTFDNGRAMVGFTNLTPTPITN